MRVDEYDDGFDSAASFEAAGADRPQDCEDPMDHWEGAVLHFGLDESFQYTNEQKLEYIHLYLHPKSQPGPPDYRFSYSEDAWLRIAENMREYGGHFAEALGIAMLRADSDNRNRIAAAFPELLSRYGSTQWGGL
jgi:hypothetical protein